MTGIVGVVQRTDVLAVVTSPVWGVCAAASAAAIAVAAAAAAVVCAFVVGLYWVFVGIGKAACFFLEPVWRLISNVAPAFRYMRAWRMKRNSTNRDNG